MVRQPEHIFQRTCRQQDAMPRPYSSFGAEHANGPAARYDDPSRAGEAYAVGFDYHSMKRKEIIAQRKRREFIPDGEKDKSYWDKRKRNNEAAKRCREKRRFNDMLLEQRVVDLTKENIVLKAQLAAIRDKFGIYGEAVISMEQIIASLPTKEQVLSYSCNGSRPHSSSSSVLGGYAQSDGGQTNALAKQSTTPGADSTSYYGQSKRASAIDAQQRHEHQRQHGFAASAKTISPPRAGYPSYSFAPILPPFKLPCFNVSIDSVLNLSRHASTALDLSGSSDNDAPFPCRSRDGPAANGNPRCPGDGHAARVDGHGGATQDAGLANVSNAAGCVGNCLPHKLRHKTHVREPPANGPTVDARSAGEETDRNPAGRWDAAGSGDDRDSGIGLNAAEDARLVCDAAGSAGEMAAVGKNAYSP